MKNGSNLYVKWRTGVSPEDCIPVTSHFGWHNLPILGDKDQLVLRVVLLRHQETAKIFAQEEQKVKDMMDLADTVVQAERVMNVSLRSHTYNVRKYSSNTTEKYKDSLLEVPHDIQAAENLSELFNPLRKFLDEQKQERLEQDKEGLVRFCTPKTNIYQTDKQE